MPITNTQARTATVWAVAVVAFVLVAQGQESTEPVPIRNDVARPLGPDDEVLMLRHHRLRKGAHEPFFQLSGIGVWPWFARIGARMTGQWVMGDPEGRAQLEYDDVYRLARYASFEHWQDTRGPRSATLGGNGPNRVQSNESLRLRRDFQETSFGGYFLQGRTATTRPVYMPGVTGDQYELVESGGVPDAGDDVIAVRNEVAARTGSGLVALYWPSAASITTRLGAARDFHYGLLEFLHGPAVAERPISASKYPTSSSTAIVSGQFLTRYFVLYLGCTLDFMPRSCSLGRQNGQAIDGCSAGV